MRSLKLDTVNKDIEFNDIIEYTFGFKYLFIKTANTVLSIDRSVINTAYRKYKDRWIKINMKKTSKKRKKKINDQEI